MTKRLFLTFLVTILAFCCTVASGQNDRARIFDRWRGQSCNDLMNEAKRLDGAGKMDSLQAIYSYMCYKLTDNDLSDADKTVCLRAMTKLGYLYASYYNDYPQAYKYLSRSLSIAQHNTDYEAMSYSYLGLALLYHSEDITGERNDNYNLTMDYLKKSFDYALQIRNWRRICYVIEDMTTFAYGAHRINGIKPYLNRFYKLPIPKNTDNYQFTTLLCHGVEFMADGKYDAAMSCFESMLRVAPPNDKGAIMTYYGNKTEIYFLRHDYASAISMMTKIKDMAVASHDLYSEAQAWNGLTEYYQAMGNEPMRKECRLRYLELQSQLLNEMGMRRIGEMRFRTQLDSAVTQLRAEQEEDVQQRAAIISAVVIAVILAILLTIIIIAYRRLRANHHELYLRNLELLRTEDNDRKELLRLRQAISALPKPANDDTKYQSSQLTDEEKDTIYIKVRQAMLDTRLICSEGFTIQQLAEVIGERQRNVSQVINEKTGGNFRSFLNEYRIREACRRINDSEHYGNLSIMGIAESVGIKSRSQFTALFRRVVGLTPTEYAKQGQGKD